MSIKEMSHKVMSVQTDDKKSIKGWKFLSLVHALRELDLPISSEDIRDAQWCLANYPDLPEKDVLRCVLVRRPQDVQLFELVWAILHQEDSSSRLFSAQSPEQHGCSEPTTERDSSGFGGLGQGRGWGGISLTHKGSLNESLHALKPVSLAQIAAVVRDGEDYEGMFKQVLGQMNYYGWINAFDLAYQRGELTEDEWNSHLAQRKMIEQEVKQELLRALVREKNSWLPVQRQQWLYKPLSSLDESEKRLVKENIRKWARILAVRPGARWKSKNKGQVDITRLVRHSVEGDGKIFRLSFRQRVPKTSELVVLCDISNSVAAYVEFLLLLASCLRDRFRKIKVYLFIDQLWDVERFGGEEELEDVMQEIKSWGYKASSGFSDYGKVFREFAETKLDSVSQRATLLILGDGKNNFRPPQPEYLAQIAARVRKVYWLNPLDVEAWGEADNALKHYRQYCTKVYRCRSASDLKHIVQKVNL